MAPQRKQNTINHLTEELNNWYSDGAIFSRNWVDKQTITVKAKLT